MLDQFIIFSQNHPLLIGATLTSVLIALTFELRKGGKPLSVNEVIKMLDDNKATIIDIRAEKDYKAGHITSSTNIPADQLLNQKSLLTKHVDKTPILVCATGTACRSSIEQLEEQGIKVQRLAGGINEWTAANVPLTR